MLRKAKRMGHPRLYLATDHAGYYERYGWERMEDGNEISGKSTRRYVKRFQREEGQI